METGFRPDDDGKVQPRNIVRRFSCRYNGEEVFSAELFPAIAANPSIAFSTLATVSGTLRFTWEGDRGFTQTESVAITVTWGACAWPWRCCCRRRRCTPPPLQPPILRPTRGALASTS